MLEKNIQKSLPMANTTDVLFKGISEIPKKVASLPVKLIKAIPKATGTILMGDEPAMKNYVKLGRFYILKKLIIFVAVILALAIASVPFIMDYLKNHDFTKVIVKGSPLQKTFDGKARLISYDSKRKKHTIYIGEFKNGNYEGSGTEYYDSGKVKYTGGFKNGNYEGTGISYFEDNAGISYYKLYEGDFKNSNYEGKGIEYFDSGKIKYEGEFKNSNYNGNGISYSEDNAGISYYKLYEGNFKNSKYEGKGTEYFDSGKIKYEGEFKNSKYSGNGKLFYFNGNIQYDGGFLDGSFDGLGVKYSSEGNKEYEGGYKKGKFSGEGNEYTIDGNVLYKGCFSDNKYNGIGTLYNEKLGDIYKGYFKDGNPFYQGFLGLSESKLKEIAGDPDKPSDDISAASSGATMNDIPISSMPTPSPTPTEESTTLSYEKYAMEFIMEPLSSTQKIPVVQVVRISGKNTVSGISCGMSYKAFKASPTMEGIEMSISNDVDKLTIVSFRKNEYVYTLYFNKTTNSLQHIEIKAQSIGESS